ncbi:MAG: LTA synthase family protein, partial [Candidatus Riflebacteria bacterium]|nr:LTA synthase family protein [Candidatus Riflebacteria bacterium]
AACAAVLFHVQKAYIKIAPALQNRFLLFYLACYILMAVFNNEIHNRSYLFHLLEGRMAFEDLKNIMIADLLFQAPGIFWGMCWFGMSFWVSRIGKAGKYLPLICSLPFCFINYQFNNLSMVFYFSALSVGLWGFFFHRKESPRKLFILWGLAFIGVLLYLHGHPIIYTSTWLLAVIVFPPVWLSGYWFIRQCEIDNNDAALSLSWLIPFASGVLLSQVTFNAPLGKALFSFWFMMVSASFAACVLLPMTIAMAGAVLASFVVRKSAKPFFFSILSLLALFYLADGILCYKNGLRLSYETLDWVWGLSNFSSILKTAISLLEWYILALFVLLMPAMAWLYRSSSKTLQPAKLTTTTFALLIVSQSSFIGYQALTSYPAVMRDPSRVLLASLPAPSILAEPTMSLEALQNAFQRCGVNTTESNNSDIQALTEALKAKADKKNLILIMLESTSNEYVSLFGCLDKTWPELEKFKDRMEIFPFFFSNFPESSNADFTTMTGFYPPAFMLLRQKPAFFSTTLARILKSAGYDCSLFFSGFIGDTGLASFYQPQGYDRLYDANSMPATKKDDGWVWGIKEHVVVDKINQLLEQKARQPRQPFFIYYRTIFPHSPFDRISDQPAPQFSETDFFQGSWVGRYKNCLLYQDFQLTRLLRQLDKTGLSASTYVVIVGDHGTMLGENGLTGHGFSLSPKLTNVPFIIINPESNGLQTNNTPGSQADILPTLCAVVGINIPPKNLIQGKNLRQKNSNNAERYIYMASLDQYAVVTNDTYFWFPLKNSASAEVYKFDYQNEKNRFIQLQTWKSEDLLTKRKKVQDFFKLQKNLLLNLEYYIKSSRHSHETH